MIYFLVGAAIVVVALCLHYSTSSYGTEEADVSPDYSDDSFSSLENLEAENDELCTNPVFSYLGCNTFYIIDNRDDD